MVFPFLDLAAELRNHIYSFLAIGDERQVRICKANGVSGVFTGLASVSRQLRNEYRPIQRSVSRVTICCDDITDFVNTFLVIEEDRVHPFKSMYISERNWTMDSQDLLPLMKVKIAHPVCWCKFKADITWRDIDPSSRTIKSMRRIQYLQGCITALNELLNNDNADWRSKIANGEITALELNFWAVPFRGLYVSFVSSHTPQDITEFRTGDDKEDMAEFFDRMWESWGFTPRFRKNLLIEDCEGGEQYWIL